MRNQPTTPAARTELDFTFWMRGLVYLMLGFVTLTLTINSYNSGIAKLPLLSVFSSLIAALFVANAIRNRRFEVFASNAVALLIVFALYTIGLSAVNYSSLYTSEAFLMWGGYFVCFLAGSQFFTTKQHIHQLLNAVAAVSAIVSIVGLAQFFFGDILLVDFYIGTSRRVGSTLANPAFLGGYIVLVWPVLLSHTITLGWGSRQSMMMILLLASLIFLLLVTQSRSSVVGFSCALFVYFILKGRRKLRIGILFMVGLVLGALVIIIFFPQLADRFTSMFALTPQSTFARRIFFWNAALSAFRAAPFFGHGPGSFEHVVWKYRSPDYWVTRSEDIVPHAHNELLEVGVESGAIGLVFVLVVVFMCLWHGMRAMRSGSDWKSTIASGIIGSIVAVSIDGLGNVSLRQPPVGAHAWLFLGILVSEALSREKQQARAVEHSLPGILGALPVIAWIAWTVSYGVRQAKVFRADSHIMQGLQLSGAAQPAASAQQFQSAVDAQPDNLFALLSLSLEHLRANRPEEALEAVERIKSLSPLYPKSSLIKAVALLAVNRLPQSLDNINEELKRREHPEAFYVQSVVFQKLDDTTHERVSLEKVLRKNMEGNVSYQMEYTCKRLMALASAHRDLEDLRNLLESARKVLPGNKTVLHTLAEIYVRLGEPGKAEVIMEKLGRARLD